MNILFIRRLSGVSLGLGAVGLFAKSIISINSKYNTKITTNSQVNVNNKKIYVGHSLLYGMSFFTCISIYCICPPVFVAAWRRGQTINLAGTTGIMGGTFLSMPIIGTSLLNNIDKVYRCYSLRLNKTDD